MLENTPLQWRIHIVTPACPITCWSQMKEMVGWHL
ncbi:hypothetical protein FKM82_026071 [Ascaphus truei]